MAASSSGRAPLMVRPASLVIAEARSLTRPSTDVLVGKVVINSLLSTERYIHSFARPVRAVALQPGFAKSSSRSFVCGGLSGSLSLMEKGWHLGGLGGLVGGGGHGKHAEKVLAEGEGPIWNIKWERSGLVAWANDLVRVSPLALAATQPAEPFPCHNRALSCTTHSPSDCSLSSTDQSMRPEPTSSSRL